MSIQINKNSIQNNQNQYYTVKHLNSLTREERINVLETIEGIETTKHLGQLRKNLNYDFSKWMMRGILVNGRICKYGIYVKHKIEMTIQDNDRLMKGLEEHLMYRNQPIKNCLCGHKIVYPLILEHLDTNEVILLGSQCCKLFIDKRSFTLPIKRCPMCNITRLTRGRSICAKCAPSMKSESSNIYRHLRKIKKVIKFGKYKNSYVSTVANNDLPYLKWMISSLDVNKFNRSLIEQCIVHYEIKTNERLPMKNGWLPTYDINKAKQILSL